MAAGAGQCVGDKFSGCGEGTGITGRKVLLFLEQMGDSLGQLMETLRSPQGTRGVRSKGEIQAWDINS